MNYSMLKHRLRAPSPALVISLIALFLALGGTSYAAGKVIVTKDKDAKADTALVKRLAPSLSVKEAKTADKATNAVNATNAVSATHATSADSAVNATNAVSATHATSATNATNLGGQPASNFLTTANRIGTNGVVKEAASPTGNTVKLFTVGPFTMQMVCTNTGTGPSLTIEASSTEANSVLSGILAATPNTPTDVGPDIGADTAFHTSSDVNNDFEAPSGAGAILVGAVGTNSLGTDCWANWSGVH